MMLDQQGTDLYPLKFAPRSLEKVWGGYKLAQMYQQGLPVDRRIGEVWVVWDQLVVDNGPQRGRKLADLVRDHPLPILGARLAGGPAVFPLLVKLIDARDTLSVQVHPGDGYAQMHEGEPYGKAEAWYIVEAEPDARLIHGLNTSLTRSGAQRAIETGTLRDMLDYVDVATEDVIMNAPGTIHALGKGILLYEIQQSSDLTYRLYDWDRHDPDRPLHIEKSLDVADLEPLTTHQTSPVVLQEPGGSRTFLAACRHFVAELLRVQVQTVERPSGDCFRLLTVLQGSGRLRYGTSPMSEVPLSSGDSVLVPAGIREYQVQAEEHPFVAVNAYVPDLLEDVVVPLRQRGVAEDTIVQLGGEPRNSDLLRYIRRDP